MQGAILVSEAKIVRLDVLHREDQAVLKEVFSVAFDDDGMQGSIDPEQDEADEME